VSLPLRLLGIDMLRALAASAVVASHIAKWPWAFSGRGGLIGQGWGLVEASMGAWGVGIFFVLSGTCIHLPMARALARGEVPRLALGPYLKRRLHRIYPPHLLVIFLSWLVAAGVALPPGFAHYLSVPTVGQFWAHIFMVHTFVPGALYSINSVLWTIAIESHFYLVYPLLLLARRRVGMEVITAALFALMLALRLADQVLPPGLRGLLTVNFPGRLWEWTLGAIVAERLARSDSVPAPRWLGLGLALASALAAALALRLPHGILVRDLLAPVGYGLVVLVLARTELRLSSPLDRALVAVGFRSYSLYLVHPIALTLAAAAMLPRVTAPLLQIAGALTAAYGLSALYFTLVERRFLPGQAGGQRQAAPRTPLASP
jgi:peptidoglycan/LPS O-acetylase OafA/YrhL